MKRSEHAWLARSPVQHSETKDRRFPCAIIISVVNRRLHSLRILAAASLTRRNLSYDSQGCPAFAFADPQSASYSLSGLNNRRRDFRSGKNLCSIACAISANSAVLHPLEPTPNR